MLHTALYANSFANVSALPSGRQSLTSEVVVVVSFESGSSLRARDCSLAGGGIFLSLDFTWGFFSLGESFAVSAASKTSCFTRRSSSSCTSRAKESTDKLSSSSVTVVIAWIPFELACALGLLFFSAPCALSFLANSLSSIWVGTTRSGFKFECCLSICSSCLFCCKNFGIFGALSGMFDFRLISVEGFIQGAKSSSRFLVFLAPRRLFSGRFSFSRLYSYDRFTYFWISTSSSLMRWFT
mmetsp:Transcript_8721/g.16176  ORF Transcript_8721/g.16176 Transcript_8721/m.16176 type:complete len:240 (-) Transcript_8721:1767-2486(-)